MSRDTGCLFIAATDIGVGAQRSQKAAKQSRPVSGARYSKNVFKFLSYLIF